MAYFEEDALTLLALIFPMLSFIGAGGGLKRITVTSFLNEILTDQLGNRVVVREGGVPLAASIPFFTTSFWIDI
jgi:hypothetical protein